MSSKPGERKREVVVGDWTLTEAWAPNQDYTFSDHRVWLAHVTGQPFASRRYLTTDGDLDCVSVLSPRFHFESQAAAEYAIAVYTLRSQA